MRRPISRPLAALCLALLSGLPAACTTTARRAGGGIIEPEPAKTWQNIITVADAARLAAKTDWWTPALAAARPHFAAALAREGALLDPAIALDHVALPPGSYKCRVVKLGGRRAPGYRTYSPFFCYVRGDGEGLAFGKQTGDERPAGWLFADGDARYVFLGAYGQGRVTPPAYGTTGARNALGIVERFAPFRWRLTLAPNDDAALTVYEVTPVAVEQQAR